VTQGVDATPTVVVSTIAGEWLQYTRTIATAGQYDIWVTGAHKQRGKNDYASIGLQFFTPGTATAVAGTCKCSTLLLPVCHAVC
jgi:hypothetical protein